MRNRTSRTTCFVFIAACIFLSQNPGFTQSVSLRWQQNPETDIEYYIIYRGATSNPTTEIARVSADETTFEDADITIGNFYYYRVAAIDSARNLSPYSEEITVATGAITPVDNQPNLPEETSLGQNYPNPFNPKTEFDYSIADASKVTLTIYDVLGRKVKTLVNGFKSSGFYRAIWDGTDKSLNKAASGIYFAKLTAGSYSQVRKIILQK